MRKAKAFSFMFLIVVMLIGILPAHTISYQGKITDTYGIGVNGVYDVTFRIYDHPTSGSLVANHLAEGVPVEKGLFTAMLDIEIEESYLWDDLYLEIEFDGDIMNPRQRIAAEVLALGALQADKANHADEAGYALEAQHADTADYTEVSGIAETASFADSAGAVYWGDIYGVPSGYSDGGSTNIMVDGYSWMSDSVVFEAGPNISISQTGNRIMISGVASGDPTSVDLGTVIQNQLSVIQDADFWIDGYGRFGGDTSMVDIDIITGNGDEETDIYPLDGRNEYWRSISLISSDELSVIDGDLTSIAIYLDELGDPIVGNYIYSNVTCWAMLTTDTIAPTTWDVSGATRIIDPFNLNIPMSEGWKIIGTSPFAYTEDFNIVLFWQGEQVAPYIGTSAPKWRRSHMGNTNMQRYGSSDVTPPPPSLLESTYRPDYKLHFSDAEWAIDLVEIYDGSIIAENNLMVHRDGWFGENLTVEGVIRGDIISHKVSTDTIYSYDRDPADTIWMKANVAINGELIVDSIQAMGDYIEMDDHVNIHGELDVDEDAYFGGLIDVADDAIIGGNADISGNIDVDGYVESGSYGYFASDLSVGGDVYADDFYPFGEEVGDTIMFHAHTGFDSEIIVDTIQPWGDTLFIDKNVRIERNLYTHNVSLDTIWSEGLDTVVVNENMKVVGELIADSIQAVGSMLYLDDNTQINGDLYVTDDARIYDDLQVDGHIVADTLIGNNVDTIVVANDFKINGELIADSIQAVGDTLYIDDHMRVHGSVVVDGTINADTADFAWLADTARQAYHADSADVAAWAWIADSALDAAHAYEADHAINADSAGVAAWAWIADSALDAAHAYEADHAINADSAGVAAWAWIADSALDAAHAYEADHAINADSAGVAAWAWIADSALDAAHAYEADHSVWADSSDWAYYARTFDADTLWAARHDTIVAMHDFKVHGELIADSIQSVGSWVYVDDQLWAESKLKTETLNAQFLKAPGDTIVINDDIFVNGKAYSDTTEVGDSDNTMITKGYADARFDWDDLTDNDIAELADVSDTPADSGQILQWNGTEWVPSTDRYRWDTLWAAEYEDVTDTLVAYDNFKVYGELIADSIQAVGDTLYIDDNMRVHGSVVVDGTINADTADFAWLADSTRDAAHAYEADHAINADSAGVAAWAWIADSALDAAHAYEADHSIWADSADWAAYARTFDSDTLWAARHDTIVAMHDFKVHGELIADSIQAVGPTVMIDDDVYIEGDLELSGGINDGSSLGTAGQFLSADGLGHYLWTDTAPMDNDWELVVTDSDADTTLQTRGVWGIARGGNTLLGTQDRTHINLGVSSTTDGQYSTVSGGFNNMAVDNGATVGGGADNVAGFEYATVGGGEANIAIGDRSVVSGGVDNAALQPNSAVGGGKENTAAGFASAVGAGYQNTATMAYANISGGYNNMASGLASFIGGGSDNTTSSSYSSVIGGLNNVASGGYSAVTGGTENNAAGERSFVAGGSFLTVGNRSFGYRGGIGGNPTSVIDVSGEDETFHIVETNFHFNYSKADADFRLDGVTDNHVFMMDASANAVGIGTMTPLRGLHVGTDAQFDYGIHDGTSFGTPGQILFTNGSNDVYWDDFHMPAIAVDTIYSYERDPADTIIVPAQMWVEGEFIADSLQAYGDTIFFDDHIVVNGKAFSTSTDPLDPAMTLITKDYADARFDNDDLTDNTIGELSDVDVTGALVGSILEYDGTNWIIGTDDVDDADADSTNELIIGIMYDDASDQLTVTDAGAIHTTIIDNEADDLSDNVVEDHSNVTAGAVATDVLIYDGTDWVPGDVNTIVTELDPIYSADDTEAELEAHLTDVTDVFTDNDGALTDDDLSDDNIDALANVDDTGAVLGDVLYFNGTAWVDTTNDFDPTNEYNTGLIWNDGIDQLQVTDGGTIHTVILDNEADDLTDDALGGIGNVDSTGKTADDVLAYDGANWVPVDVNGLVVETDPIFEQNSIEDSLEAHLTDVTDIYTNNDGALDDDDITNDVIGDLNDVTVPGALAGEVLEFDGTNWVNATDDVDDADNDPTNEYNTGLIWTDATDQLQVTDAGAIHTVILDNEADDLTDDALGGIGNVDSTGKTADDVLAYDGANWVPVDVNGLVVETDPIFEQNSIEDSLEAHLTDVTDIYTNNDGALDDDDITNDVIGDLNDVTVPGALAGEVLEFDGTNWVNATDDVDDADHDPTNEYNTGLIWTDGTDQLQITDAGTVHNVTIDNEADDLSDDALGSLGDVDTSGKTADDVLAYDGSDWVPVDVNALVTEVDPIFEQNNIEDSLEAHLTDVTDIYTNNDGALTDDDLSDNNVGDLSNVDETGAALRDVLYYNGTTWADTTNDYDPTNEHITAFAWDDGADQLTVVDLGASWTVNIENEADELSDNDVEDLGNVTAGAVATEVLIYDGSDWVPGDVNTVVTELDPVYGADDTEAELEAHLVDVADVYTDNDGALTDDDLSDDVLTDIGNVNTTGIANTEVLAWNSVALEWQPAPNAGTDDQTLAEVLTSGNTANMDINMNNFTLTGIADASANGEPIAYGQAAGGDLAGTYPAPTIAVGAIQDAEMDYAAVTLADFTDDVGYATEADLADASNLTAPVHWDGLTNVPLGFADGTDDDDLSDNVLGDIGNVNNTGLANGDIIRYNGFTTNWEVVSLTVNSLENASEAGAVNGSILKYDGSDWVVATDEVDDADADPTNELVVGFTWDDLSDALTLTDAGGAIALTIDDEDDDLSDNSITDLSDVNTVGVTNGQVLVWNGTTWVPGDDAITGDTLNAPTHDTLVVDEAFQVLGELIADSIQAVADTLFLDDHIVVNGKGFSSSTDPADPATTMITKDYADARFDLDDVSDDNIGGLANVDETGAIAGSNLEYDGANWIVGIDDVDDADADPTNELNTAVTYNPATTQLSVYDAGGSVTTLIGIYEDSLQNNSINDLGDVDTSGINNGDVLTWDGTNWIPGNGINDTLRAATADTLVIDNDVKIIGELIADSIQAVGDTIFLDDHILVNGKAFSNSTAPADPATTMITKDYADANFDNDDVSDDNIGGLANVDETGAIAGSILEYDGANWIVGADDVDDADNDPTNELNTGVAYNPVTQQILIADAGGVVGTVIDVTPDDLTDDNIGTLANVDETGAVLGSVLKYDGSDWIVGVDGGLTSETDPIYGADDTEAELEAHLTDVANVYTDNDGALTDDDVSDDNIGGLANVDETGAIAGSILEYDGSDWVVGTDAVDDADNDPTNELNTGVAFNPATQQISIADAGGVVTTVIDVTPDDLTDDNIGTLANVNETGAINGSVLKYDGTNWIVGTDNDGVTVESDPVFSAMNTEAALEAQIGIDVLKASDGSFDEDDVTDDNIGDLANVDETGAAVGSILEYDGTDWVVGTDAVDDADNDPTNELISGFVFNDGTNQLSISDPGGVWTTPLNNDADDITNDPIGALADVDVTGAINGSVLKFDGTDWIVGTDNTGMSAESDPIFSAMNTEAALEAQIGVDVLKASDGSFDEDDLSDNSIDDVNDVDVTSSAPSIGEVLKWDGTNWVPAADLNAIDTDDQTLAEVLTQGNQANMNIDMNSYKLTGIAPATLAGDAIIFGQAAGGDLTGTYPSPTIANGAVADAEIDYGQVTLADFTNDAGFINAATLNDGSTATNPVGWNDITGAPTNYSDDDLSDDNIAALANVDETGKLVGHVLKWDGVNWSPATDATGAPATTEAGLEAQITDVADFYTDNDGVLEDLSDNSIDDLNDVSSSSASNGQVLKWNGTHWVPGDDNDTGGGSTGDLDTIAATRHDTVVVSQDFKIMGELIADSIQAVGDVIYMDDNINVYGYISRDNNTLYGTNSSTHINLGENSATGASGFNYSYSTIGGGYSNVSAEDYTTVGGGNGNQVTGEYATVAGGQDNTASGSGTAISGGYNNTASGDRACVIGGHTNTATSDYSSVCGGQNNDAAGLYSAVIGGSNNDVSMLGLYSSIGGGQNNAVNGTYSTIPGGYALTVGSGSFGFRGGLGFGSFDASSENNTFHIVDAAFHFNNDNHANADFRIESENNDDMLFMDANTDRIGIGTDTPVSTFEVNGSEGRNVTTLTSTSTLDETHNVVLAHGTSLTVNLPAASTCTGRVYTIKNINATSATVDADGTETIDGNTTISLSQYEYIEIISDGSNWYIISNN